MFLLLLLALSADPKAPAIRVAGGKAVEATGLPDSFKHKTLEEWAAALRVVLADNADTALLGTHTLADGTLKFEPRFPFVPGVKYRAIATVDGRESTHDFALAKPKVEPGRVSAIYPSGDKLAENTLRFYIHFSKPMAKGDIYKHVVLRNDTDRKIVELPFLELEEELWTLDQTRVTFLIDPGRIKREVRPRIDLGPTLEEGKTFTLTVAKAWKDADGEPLTVEFRKTFTVGKSDREAIDPEKWTFKEPKSGGRDALTIAFGKPLDSGLAQRLIQVEDAAGKTVTGTIALGKNESEWTFTPTKPWPAGNYALRIATHLEDPSGNRVGEPFEVDLLEPVGKPADTATSVTRAFAVK
jgi:hypothetical protein